MLKLKFNYYYYFKQVINFHWNFKYKILFTLKVYYICNYNVELKYQIIKVPKNYINQQQ